MDDLISRKDVLHELDWCDYGLKDWQKWKLKMMVRDIPSAKPKIGHWIMTRDYFTGAYESIDYVKCSCCGEDSLEMGDYCPNCGAKMIEPQESEDKE